MRGELRLKVLGRGPVHLVRLHAGLDQRTQLVGEPGQVGSLAQQHEHGLDRVGAVEGRVPGRREHQGGAQREDIAGARHAAGVPRLLGRHVRGCPHGDVGHRQPGVGDTGRDAEVDDAGAVLHDEDVGRFEVAVDQARAVDGLEGLRDARREPAHGLRGQWTALVHYLFEGGCGDIRRREPRHRRPGVGVHDGGRVEAADRAGGLHLACEADTEQLVLGELGAHGLDRHPAAGRRPGEIDQPHASGSEPAQHLERTDPSRIVLRQLLHTCLPPPRMGPCLATEAQRPPVAVPTLILPVRARGCEPGGGSACVIPFPTSKPAPAPRRKRPGAPSGRPARTSGDTPGGDGGTHRRTDRRAGRRAAGEPEGARRGAHRGAPHLQSAESRADHPSVS